MEGVTSGRSESPPYSTSATRLGRSRSRGPNGRNTSGRAHLTGPVKYDMCNPRKRLGPRTFSQASLGLVLRCARCKFESAREPIYPAHLSYSSHPRYTFWAIAPAPIACVVSPPPILIPGPVRGHIVYKIPITPDSSCKHIRNSPWRSAIGVALPRGAVNGNPSRRDGSVQPSKSLFSIAACNRLAGAFGRRAWPRTGSTYSKRKKRGNIKVPSRSTHDLGLAAPILPSSLSFTIAPEVRKARRPLSVSKRAARHDKRNLVIETSASASSGIRPTADDYLSLPKSRSFAPNEGYSSPARGAWLAAIPGCIGPAHRTTIPTRETGIGWTSHTPEAERRPNLVFRARRRRGRTWQKPHTTHHTRSAPPPFSSILPKDYGPYKSSAPTSGPDTHLRGPSSTPRGRPALLSLTLFGKSTTRRIIIGTLQQNATLRTSAGPHRCHTRAPRCCLPKITPVPNPDALSTHHRLVLRPPPILLRHPHRSLTSTVFTHHPYPLAASRLRTKRGPKSPEPARLRQHTHA